MQRLGMVRGQRVRFSLGEWAMLVLLAAVILSPVRGQDKGGGKSPQEAAAAEKAASPVPALPGVPPEQATQSIEELAQRVRSALVSISVAGREDRQVGLGTGFVISADGLIATNLHVIGEGHRFTVELADGTELQTTSVYASESDLDLAILQVKRPDKPLSALPLGDSESLRQGAALVAMGNPLGLKHSVVAGVLSAKREINGRPMLQLAMPIEPGNSGGPVLDMQGRVMGLVNMKSVVNENLGFAVEVNSLKPLLERPNPIPVERWATIGGIDLKRWQPLFGANWRQRAGRILVSGPGTGFGGRSLCLYQEAPPEVPFELAVEVRLNDESGAAGLVFHSDGSDRHYGFYPSNGNLRLTCFEGPSVEQWRVLDERPSDAYRPGEWNQLKVHLEKGKLLCYVNDQLVMQSVDESLLGKVGLAKFRQTEAEFRQFQFGRELSAGAGQTLDLTALGYGLDQLTDLAAMSPERLAVLAEHGDSAVDSLRRQARELEQQAVRLQRLAGDVHVAGVARDLATLVDDRDDGFDLLRAALLIARFDEEDIDIDGYLQIIDRMAAEIRAGLNKDVREEAKLAALHGYLFQQNGYHGSRFEYYHRANSYLNRVIDDRAGLPITLSVLYLELGRRLGLTLEGVGLPSHFVVRFVPDEGNTRLIDVFAQGKTMSREEAERLVREQGISELRDEHLRAQTSREILRRMVNNLWGTAERSRDFEALLRYAEALVAIEPGSIDARLKRAFLRGETGRRSACLADLDWIIEREPPGVDLDRIREFRDHFQHRRR